MSLENQIANLVSAANNLTSEVAGKMRQIDNKVDAATQAVPNTIRKLSEQTVCVDAVEGDDSNDGLSASPVKTVGEAIKRHISGSYTNIKLKEGQTHATVGGGSAFSVSSGVIQFDRWGETSGVNNPIAKNTTEYAPNYNGNRGRFISLRSGALIFNQVDIDSVDVDNGEPLVSLDGFIYTYLSNVSVFFIGSKIRLTDRPVFGSSTSGRSMINCSLESSSIEIVSNRANRSRLILGGSAVYSLGVGNVTLPADVTWSDLIPVNANASNILTNIDVSALTP
ncbi:hypothetical protein ACDI10_16530 [Vreelandella venusta]|uniref:hypothetical protein n=1 Tax=Vreelandella venusta TaxID=44935 RepID=UPI00355622D0